MNKLTRLVATSGATLALAMGLAAPVGATESHSSTENNSCVGIANCNSETDNSNNSKNFGPCTIFGADQSTTNNVTNVTQAAAAAPAGGRGAGEAAQVSSTPSGGVGAGAGGAAKSSAVAVTGLSSSLGVLGLGLRLSKRAFQL
jgi:hypothetical protein